MPEKQRYQNPAIGDTVVLKMFTYNANARASVSSVEQVDIYFLDKNERTDINPDGRRLVETITDIETISEGQYSVSALLEEGKYTIGRYLDIWTVKFSEESAAAEIENNFEIFPSLWFTTPIPVVYDFNFSFKPNRFRIGSKRWIMINVVPNVPRATDLEKYYENLTIVSPIKVSIEKDCGDCVPTDSELIVENADVDFREKNVGYYFLDTDDLDLDCGLYNIWFQLEFGENLYISDKQKFQIM